MDRILALLARPSLYQIHLLPGSSGLPGKGLVVGLGLGLILLSKNRPCQGAIARLHSPGQLPTIPF